MKNLSLGLNIVLIIAVSFLYYKVYKGENATVVSGISASSSVVYVNSDSLMEHYQLFKTLEASMEHKKDSLDQLFSERGRAIETEIQQYQQTGASLSAQQRQLKEETLTKKQQSYIADRDLVLASLKKEEELMLDSVHNDLQSYFKAFNQKHGYHFIMGYSRGNGILYANDSLNITKAVLEGLNKQ